MLPDVRDLALPWCLETPLTQTTLICTHPWCHWRQPNRSSASLGPWLVIARHHARRIRSPHAAASPRVVRRRASPTQMKLNRPPTSWCGAETVASEECPIWKVSHDTGGAEIVASWGVLAPAIEVRIHWPLPAGTQIPEYSGTGSWDHTTFLGCSFRVRSVF